MMIIVFSVSGFVMAYIAHIRTSEGLIGIAALIIFAVAMLADSWRIKREDFRKVLINLAIVFMAGYAGYIGYYQMVGAFEYHRDRKLNLPAIVNRTLSGHPIYHNLFISLFRYEVPNKYGDKIG